MESKHARCYSLKTRVTPMLGLRPCAKHNVAADVRENKASLHEGWDVAATSGLMGSAREICPGQRKSAPRI
ncbi:hypothetical protein WN943_006344 [Citrus x changshan-huyou]